MVFATRLSNTSLKHCPLLVACFTALAPSMGLGQGSLWEIQGSSAATFFGEAVTAFGDYDGDGVVDLLVGEPGYNPGSAPETGRIGVYSGATQSLILSIVNSSAGVGLGCLIPPPGDLTGDAQSEILSRVYIGSSFSGRAIQVYSSTGAFLATWPGGAGGVVGDLDGDALSDMVIGQDFWNSPWCSGDQGRAYAVSGAQGPTIMQWTGLYCAPEIFGFAIASMGDVSGDGFPDFAVSAQGLGSLPSAVWMYSGVGPSPIWVMPFYFPPIPSMVWADPMRAVGDVDEDGIEDLLAGFYWAPDPGWFGANPPGVVRVLSGATGSIVHTIQGYYPNQRLGKAVARLGDLDGDGHADIMVGAPYGIPWFPGLSIPSGTSTLQGRVYVFSGNNGTVLLEIAEAAPWDGFGSSLDGIGDYDGDDYPDFVVGEPWRQPPNPGRIIAFSGAPSGVDVFDTGCPGSSGAMPRIAAWPSVSPGGSCAVNLSQAAVNASALLLIGSSNTSWHAAPLPFSLGTLGMPQCKLLVSPDFVFSASASGSGPGKGHASVTLALPGDPGLIGATFYAQWYVVDPGPAFFPGAMTRGLAITIQP